jgi:hypothetical protein
LLVNDTELLSTLSSKTRLSPFCGTVPPQLVQLPAVPQEVLLAPVHVQVLPAANTAFGKVMTANSNAIKLAATAILNRIISITPQHAIAYNYSAL